MTKKLLSVLLALVLALSMALPALADDAAIDVEGELVILHTNDVHGRAVDGDGVFGYSRVADVKKQLEKLGASVLLLDAGDFSQGTPLVDLEYGKQAYAFLNAAGYDAATVGNHEFDFGIDNLLQNAETAEFAILCATVTDTISGEAKFAPNKIFDMPNGMKVGVFGLTTPETYTKAHPDKIKGISFAQGEELYKIAQAQVDELKAAGCNLIVALGHMGVDGESEPNRSVDVIEKVNGIDLFIDGHSHTEIPGGELHGTTLLTSVGSLGKNLGYVIVDDDDKKMVAGLYNGVDATVEELVNSANAAVNDQLSAPFATTEVLLNGERAPGVRTEETNLGDFATDAMLWAAKNALGDDKADCALTNGGGIRTSLQIGEITMLDMKTVFPFGNEVTVIMVTGAELLEAIEAATSSLPEASGGFPQVSGITYTVDTSIPFAGSVQYEGSTYYKPDVPGTRVTIETVAGEPFDPERIYNLVTNDFTAAGGDQYCVFKYAYQTAGYKTGVALETALVQYTQEVLGGVIGADYAAPMGRITVK